MHPIDAEVAVRVRDRVKTGKLTLEWRSNRPPRLLSWEGASQTGRQGRLPLLFTQSVTLRATMRSFNSPVAPTDTASLHHSQRQRVAIQDSIRGADRSDDGEDDTGQTHDDQKRNANHDETKRNEAQRVNDK